MMKCALIIQEQIESDNTLISIVKSIGCKIKFLSDKWKCNHFKYESKDKEFILYIIKINTNQSHERLVKTIHKQIEYLREENVSVIALDEYFNTNYLEYFDADCGNSAITICNGENIYFSVLFPAIRKLLKSKGLDINDIEVAIIPNEKTNEDMRFIAYLSPYIKYLTYISESNESIKRVIDQVYDEVGASVRMCNNLEANIKDIGLIFNFGNQPIDLNIINVEQKVIIIDRDNSYEGVQTNTSILRDVIINASGIIENLPKLSNGDIRKICEMYMMSKTDIKLIRKNVFLEGNADNIYKAFKESSFKIGGLEGINL